MKVYTFSDARQQLASVLNQARRDGEIRIRRRDGQEFLVQPAPMAKGSPLEVPGLDLRIPIPEIVGVVRESRRSTERFLRLSPRKATDPTRGSRPSRRGRTGKKD